MSLHIRTHITLNANLGISVERYTMGRLVCSITFVETRFSVGEFLVVDTLQIMCHQRVACLEGVDHV